MPMLVKIWSVALVQTYGRGSSFQDVDVGTEVGVEPMD
ncbi:hypothetical protein OEM_21450 [Mycobacterium intracellulare subsp. yongonense 05-1390]|nr:hypothetical protein OEM_21450 [Mycobacterium intracellulare subsp. yongonense 05-1390]ARR77795.1 hypothetical protein MOTT12_02131 [Mycobacterium intracellulare subsp. yongonense]